MPTPEFNTEIPVAGLTAFDVVEARVSGRMPPSKDPDEFEMGLPLIAATVVAPGRLGVRLVGTEGFIHGEFIVEWWTHG